MIQIVRRLSILLPTYLEFFLELEASYPHGIPRAKLHSVPDYEKDELINEGWIYTTFDEYHYRPTETFKEFFDSKPLTKIFDWANKLDDSSDPGYFIRKRLEDFLPRPRDQLYIQSQQYLKRSGFKVPRKE